jgi:hypothetical protein
MDQLNNKKEESNPVENIGHIFRGSIGLLGVSLTIISLFQIADKRAVYLVDDLLCISSALFILSTTLSYLSLKKNAIKYAVFADVVFRIGLLSMFIVGIFLVLHL